MFNYNTERRIRNRTYIPTYAEVELSTSSPPIAFPLLASCEVEFLSKNFSISGLSKGTLFSNAPFTADFNVVYEWVKKNYPVNGKDMLYWMHTATATNVFLDRSSQDYKESSGSISTDSGDACIPGVEISSSFKFKSEYGSTVAERGYAIVITPYGNVQVPVPGKKTIIYKDFLGWGAVPEALMVQFVGILIRYEKLAKNPENLSIPNLCQLTPPLFFEHQPPMPFPVNRISAVISTSDSQTIQFNFRNINNYAQKVSSLSAKLDQGAGEYKVVINLYGLPYVPSLCVEMQPENNVYTILRKWDIIFPQKPD